MLWNQSGVPRPSHISVLVTSLFLSDLSLAEERVACFHTFVFMWKEICKDHAIRKLPCREAGSSPHNWSQPSLEAVGVTPCLCRSTASYRHAAGAPQIPVNISVCIYKPAWAQTHIITVMSFVDGWSSGRETMDLSIPLRASLSKTFHGFLKDFLTLRMEEFSPSFWRSKMPDKVPCCIEQMHLKFGIKLLCTNF